VAISASDDSLNWDLISSSRVISGMSNIFVKTPASATFWFLPRSLNWSPLTKIPFFFRALECVLIVRSSRATRTSALASWDSIG